MKDYDYKRKTSFYHDNAQTSAQVTQRSFGGLPLGDHQDVMQL